MPCLPAVGCLEEASTAPIDEVVVFPRALSGFPHRGIQYVGVRSIDFHIGGSGVFVFVQHFFPVFSAIARAKHTSFLAWSIRMTKDGGHNPIGIARVDNECRNLLSLS